MHKNQGASFDTRVLEEMMKNQQMMEEPNLMELQEDYENIHDESNRLQKKVEESQANQVLLNASHSDIECAEWEAKVKMDENVQYTKDLQKQQRECHNEGAMIDKQIQEEIVRSNAEVKGRAVEMREVIFNNERRERKQRENETGVADERQREKCNRAPEDRSDAVVAEWDRKIEERRNFLKILGDNMVTRREHEYLASMIDETERFEKRAESDVRERQRLDRRWEEIASSNESQKPWRQHAARELQGEEDRFGRASEKRFAFEDAHELKKEGQKTERDNQYSLDLQEQIADNAGRRAADKKAEQTREQDRYNRDQDWRAHASDESKMCSEEFAVPRLVSNSRSDVAQRDDNVRESKRQSAVEEKQESEKERQKTERNHQYSLDLQEQIADNARRRAADKESELLRGQRESRNQESHERKRIQDDKDWKAKMGGHTNNDEEPVERTSDGFKYDDNRRIGVRDIDIRTINIDVYNILKDAWKKKLKTCKKNIKN